MKSYLTNLTTYHEMTRLVVEERTVDVVYLDFSKAFSSLSRKNLAHKLNELRTRQMDSEVD